LPRLKEDALELRQISTY